LADITYPSVYGILTSANTLNVYNLHSDLTGTVLSSIILPNSRIELYSTNNEKFFSYVASVNDTNNTITLKDNFILNLSNVAYGYTNSSNVFVTSLTGKFDVINSGSYSNANNYLTDIVYVGDTLTINNNSPFIINNIDYLNRVISNTALTLSDSGNCLISITRSFIANNIIIDYIEPNNEELLAYGNTVTSINIDGFDITDQSNNIIYAQV
jgi:hypothetical protein